MFQGRLPLLRTAAVAAASACCLTAVACGSGNADPLASLSGTKVAAEAVANAKAASSLTLAGDASESGATYTVNLGIKPGKGCAGTVGLGGKGSVKLMVIGTTVYMKPDATFWKSSAGSEAATVIQLINGRYLRGSTTDSSMSGLSDICDLSRLLKNNASGKITKGKVTTLNGVRVLPLSAPDGGKEYVTDASKPELVAMIAPRGTKGGSGKVTVTIGAPVTLAAPPPSQVLDAARLGM